ncbi:MAG: monovalent cation/H(+) antiporter subunit G [Eubacteriales bacterium]
MDLRWIQIGIGLIAVIMGLGFFMIGLYGIFRMRYVLNRMHATAVGDTLGISMSLIGLIFLHGISLTSLKLVLVMVFMALSSPVSSHLIAHLELLTTTERGRFLEIDKVTSTPKGEE